MGFQERINAGLDRALERARASGSHDELERLDSYVQPLVIFSDHHKGARNRADDFLPCEATYLSALSHYFDEGYRLAVLGDGEELWEELPQAVVRAYPEVFSAEAEFHHQGRYSKFWGNHDESWSAKPVVSRCLRPGFGEAVPELQESACYMLVEEGEELGILYLVHGHQGTANSERWAMLTRMAVRWLWRPVQRLTGFSTNTPSSNRELRNRHNSAMFHWASRQDRLILVTGHTHRPVFGSLSWLDELEEELEMDADDLFSHHAGKCVWDKLDEMARRPDWVENPDRSPCYFNSGCCCYPDGSITGIEIAAGDMRLIRWDSADGVPLRRVLATAPLRNLFAHLATSPSRRAPGS